MTETSWKTEAVDVLRARPPVAQRPHDGTLPTMGTLADRAYEALLREVWLTPKPGLVDLRNTGAHRDMTVGTFEVSAIAIRPFFDEFTAAGAASADAPAPHALAELREIGMACERAMFRATHGVNTHKGAIFAFGLLLGAAGRLLALGKDLEADSLCREVALITAGLVGRELNARHRTASTAGEHAFQRYGLAGARGEAQSGFATVRTAGLPAFREVARRGGSTEHALLAAMVDLLTVNADTNLIARGGPGAVTLVRHHAVRVTAAGPFAPDFRHRLVAMDDILIERNLSPGGTADLVGVTWFLAQLPTERGV